MAKPRVQYQGYIPKGTVGAIARDVVETFRTRLVFEEGNWKYDLQHDTHSRQNLGKLFTFHPTPHEVQLSLLHLLCIAMRSDSLRLQSISFVVPATPAPSTHARSRLIGTGIGRMPLRRGPVPRAAGRTRAAVGMPPSAQLNPGDEVEGRVTRLVRYGAFVDLGANGSGLVHISEVTDSFVSDISAHLKEGDVVLVRVLSVDANNDRIALSMKQSTAAIPSGYDRVIELGGDWGHPWNDDGQAQYADLGPRTKGPEAWEPDPDLFRKWDAPKDNDDT